VTGALPLLEDREALYASGPKRGPSAESAESGADHDRVERFRHHSLS
jgi:hypothetical protein